MAFAISSAARAALRGEVLGGQGQARLSLAAWWEASAAKP